MPFRSFRLCGSQLCFQDSPIQRESSLFVDRFQLDSTDQMGFTYVYELSISGLNESISEQHLVKAFEGYGELVESKILVESKKKKTITTGSVIYGTKEEAKTATRKMNGQRLEGCKLKVKYAKRLYIRPEKTDGKEDEVPEVQTSSEICDTRGVKGKQSCEHEAEQSGEEHGSEFSANKKRDHREQALELQQLVFDEYIKRNYAEASKLCNEAINLSPNSSVFYMDRALCHMMLNKSSKALDDARQSVKLGDRSIEAYEVLIKCCLIMGEESEADRNLKIAINIEPTYNILTMKNELAILRKELDAARESYSIKEYNQAISHLNNVLKVSPHCTKFKIMKAECQALLRKLSEALRIVTNILEIDPQNVKALYVRGLCSYYYGNITKAAHYFYAVQQLAPENSKAVDMLMRSVTLRKLTLAGENAFNTDRFTIAVDCFSTALTVDVSNDTINKITLFNKALATFKLGLWREALKDCIKVLNQDREFTKAILLRAECRLSLEEFEKAAEDYEMAIYLHHRCPKVFVILDDVEERLLETYKKLVKRSIMNGEIRKAELWIHRAFTLKSDDEMRLQMQKDVDRLKIEFDGAKKHYARKEFDKALSHARAAMKFAPHSMEMKIMTAKCLVYLKKYQEAGEILDDILEIDSQNADAIYVRGLCFYNKGNDNEAMSWLQKAIKIVRYHPKAAELNNRIILLREIKLYACKAFRANQFDKAHQYFTKALEIDPSNGNINATLYFNRGLTSFKMGNLVDSIQDYTEALLLEEKYLKALLGRANCHMDLGQFAEAERDYEMAYEIERCPEIRTLLNRAKWLRKRQPEQPDLYTILGIKPPFTFDEIKKAYYEKARQFHPDRHANVSPAQKKYYETKFKEVKNAFDILAKRAHRTQN